MQASLLLILIFTTIELFIHGEPQQFKTHGSLTKNGDVMLAGLFPIHLYNSISKRYELNTHALAWGEAMIFAIEEINANASLLRNISIGYTIHDTCNEIETAMQTVLKLMLDDTNEANSSFLNDQHVKISDNMTQNTTINSVQSETCACRKPSNRVLSVIGGASSKISASISNVLSVDLVPQISYSSTSQDLSNKDTFPSFLRTIPPDSYQSQFIVDILVHYNWKYVNVLASDDEYGRVGVNYLLPQLLSRGICVGVHGIFGTVLKLDEIEDIMRKIIDEKQAKVTILWSGKQLARSVIAVAANMSLHNRTWIATEAWGNDEELLKTDPNVVSGLFGVVSSMISYQPFEDSIVNKSISDLKLYRLIAQTVKDCDGLHLSQKSCTELYLFKDAPQLSRDKISNVVDAVYAFAHGLDSVLRESSISGESPKTRESSLTRESSVMTATSPGDIDLNLLLQSIKNINKTGTNETNRVFNENGDPTTAVYSLINLKETNGGALQFQVIAHWNSQNRKIEFSASKNIFYAGDGISIPQSKCGDECQPGFYAFRHANKKCCWTCVRCPVDSYKSRKGESLCRKCPKNSISNSNNTGCTELDERYLDFDSSYGITLIITMLTEVVPCITSMFTFIVFRNTPLVRSSNRGLSLLQLTTSILASLFPLLHIGKPTLPICYARPVAFGVLFTISNSIIFNKADRLLRIFRMRHRIKSGQILLSNKFQFFIVLLLASISVATCMILFSISEPKVTEYISRQDNAITIKCDNTSILTYTLLAYINIIAVTCIIYTIKSRNLPRQYREKRYIGLAMFVATLAWVAHIPVSLSTASDETKSFAFCLSAQIANGVLLIVIYGPKTWTILIHPEENVATVVHRNKIGSHLSTNSEAFAIPLPKIGTGNQKESQIETEERKQEQNRKRSNTKRLNNPKI